MKRIYGIRSVFGGTDYYDEYGMVGYSIPGIGGGEDYYGVDGETGYSVPSAYGMDCYGPRGRRVYSVPSLLSGQDICGDVSGYTVEAPFGEDVCLDDTGP